jgi:hypothetical protein
VIGGPVNSVNVDLSMSLETEEPVQGEPVVAASVEAYDKNYAVENIDHGAQPQLGRRFCVVTPCLPRPCEHFPPSQFSDDEAANAVPA